MYTIILSTNKDTLTSLLPMNTFELLQLFLSLQLRLQLLYQIHMEKVDILVLFLIFVNML